MNLKPFSSCTYIIHAPVVLRWVIFISLNCATRITLQTLCGGRWMGGCWHPLPADPGQMEGPLGLRFVRLSRHNVTVYHAECHKESPGLKERSLCGVVLEQNLSIGLRPNKILQGVRFCESKSTSVVRQPSQDDPSGIDYSLFARLLRSRS